MVGMMVWVMLGIPAPAKLGIPEPVIPWKVMQNEAQKAPHGFDVLSYDLTLRVDVAGGLQIQGHNVITYARQGTNTEFYFMLNPTLTLDSVVVNGVNWAYTRHLDTIRFVVSVGDPVVVEVDYHGTPPSGSWFGGGMYYDAARQLVFTDDEPYGLRRWFAGYDGPDDKATLTLHIDVPAGWVVGANGVLVGKDTVGSRWVYHWQEQYPIASYLIHFAASPNFALIRDTVQIDTFLLPIEQYFLRSESTKVAGEFADLPDMLQYFSQVYGLYPFIQEKYGHTGVTSGWAMENQTLTAYFRDSLRGDTYYDWIIAHELAHQWWGDWVTLDNFTHIWLNEGFATYGEALYIGHRDSASNPSAYADYVQSEMNQYFTWLNCQDQWGYPIVPPYSLFGCNSYTKGGLVLHMLRGVLGDSLFFEGLRQYGQQYGYGNVVTLDFQNVMEAVSGQDLTWFFQEWVYAPGFPYYLYAWDWRAGTLWVAIRQIQRDSVDAGAPYFEMPIRLRLRRAVQGDTVVVVRNHAVALETLWVAVGDSVTAVLLDDGNWILEKHMQVPTGVSEGRALVVPRIGGMRFVCGGQLEVDWEGPGARVPVRVVDMLGRERWSRVVEMRRGRQLLRVGRLPSGVYRVQVGPAVRILIRF